MWPKNPPSFRLLHVATHVSASLGLRFPRHLHRVSHPLPTLSNWEVETNIRKSTFGLDQSREMK